MLGLGPTDQPGGRRQLPGADFARPNLTVAAHESGGADSSGDVQPSLEMMGEPMRLNHDAKAERQPMTLLSNRTGR